MSRKLWLIPTLALALFVAPAATPRAATGDASLETDEQKLLYTMGMIISQRFKLLELAPEQVAIVEAGFTDGLLGKDARVDLATYGPRLDGFLNERAAAITEKEKAAGSAYCAKEAEKPGASKTESGAIYFEVAGGEGNNPAVADRVRINYHGTLPDGTVFDTTRKEGGTPAEFALSGVIPCFREGLSKMKVGGKARLVCPSETAYGERGSPPTIRPGATIVFEVELLEILAAAPAVTP